jgi:hypothetical protein
MHNSNADGTIVGKKVGEGEEGTHLYYSSPG